MLFARSATNCFSIAENTRPVLFQVMIPSQRAWCASATQRNPSQQDILLHLTAVSVFLSIPSLLLRFYLISFACSSALLSLFFCFSFRAFLHFSFSQLVSTPIAFQFLGLLLTSPSSFPHLVSPLCSCSPLLSSVLPSHLFASVLLHGHQRLYTEQRVITFVLHRDSLIGFMPPASATSAEKEIEAFCHI